MYGFDPNTVAAMTPHQQLVLLEDDEGDPTVNTLHFATMDRYVAWLGRQDIDAK